MREPRVNFATSTILPGSTVIDTLTDLETVVIEASTAFDEIPEGVPFDVVLYPNDGSRPTKANSEIVRVTRTENVLDIVENGRGRQRTTVRAPAAGWRVEQNLTARWFHEYEHEIRRGCYLAAFNGDSDEAANDYTRFGYICGFAISDDGGRTFRPLRDRVLYRNAANVWENDYAHGPSLVRVGRRLFVFYMAAGLAGTHKIAVAIWNNGNPVGAPDVRQLLIDTATGEAWEQHVLFPHPYYDEESDELHLWYSGGAANIVAANIGHAIIDPDTLTVTKDAGNPIISFDAGAGEGGVQMGCVVNDGVEWHLFASVFSASPGYTGLTPTRWTADSILGPWTKQGAVYTPRTTAIQALAADAAAGATSLQVGDSSLFEVGDPVYVQDNLAAQNVGVTTADNWEIGTVQAIPDATHLTLREPLLNSYTTARAAEVVAVDQVKMQSRGVFREEGEWVFTTTAFGAGSHTYHENTVALRTRDLGDTPYELDRRRGVLIRQTGSTGATRNAWWKTKAENMHVIPLPGAVRIHELSERNAQYKVMKKRTGFAAVKTTSWTAVSSPGPPNAADALDCFMPALAGDVIRITPAFLLSNEALFAYFDVAVHKVPAGVSTLGPWLSGGTGVNAVDQGIMAWRSAASVYVNQGASILYTLLATDIEGGMIWLRPMMRLSGSGTRTFVGLTAVDLSFCYENLGGGHSAA